MLLNEKKVNKQFVYKNAMKNAMVRGCFWKKINKYFGYVIMWQVERIVDLLSIKRDSQVENDLISIFYMHSFLSVI